MRRRTLLATAALAAGSTGCLFGSRRFPRLGSIRVHIYHPEPTTVIVEVLDDDDLVLETTVDVPAGNDDDSATAGRLHALHRRTRRVGRRRQHPRRPRPRQRTPAAQHRSLQRCRRANRGREPPRRHRTLRRPPVQRRPVTTHATEPALDARRR